MNKSSLHSQDNTVQFAMNLSGHSSRVSRNEVIINYLPHQLEACNDISEALKKQ